MLNERSEEVSVQPPRFSNESRCAHCVYGPRLIRIHWCPYAVAQNGACAGPGNGSNASGGHFHRHCPCGAEWIER